MAFQLFYKYRPDLCGVVIVVSLESSNHVISLTFGLGYFVGNCRHYT